MAILPPRRAAACLYIRLFPRILNPLNALIVFQNITLIDGTGREPLPDATVAVRDQQIVYAGKARRWQPSLEEDILTLDFGGKYLLPGLIDCHIHLAGSGEVDGRYATDDGSMVLRMLRNARKNLAAGFTAVRDLGGWRGLEFAVRAAIQRGDFSGPRLVAAGRFISNSKSEALQHEGMIRPARGSLQIRRAVQEQARRGAEVIQLGVTGAMLVEGDKPGAVQLSLRDIKAAVEEAARAGLRVAAHAHGADGIRRAVSAGVDSIEHGTYLFEQPTVIEEMKGRGTFLVSTLKASRDIIRCEPGILPAWMVERAREAYEAARKSVRLAYQAGVPVAMGSGASSPLNYHGDNALEVHLLQQAGLKPMDALAAATLAAARALHREERIGSVEEGKAADLLVLDANPLEDLKRLADKKLIRAVFRDGKLVARQASDAYPRTVLARDCLTIGQ